MQAQQILTEKEKQTLRLVVQGCDAKSIASHLGLAVHTVNERLRHARRKMEVSSSREAGRKLREEERKAPDLLADKDLGEAEADGGVAFGSPDQSWLAQWRWPLLGVIAMSIIIATLAIASLATPPHEAAERLALGESAATQPAPVAVRSDPERAATAWLELVDHGKWDESWNATGAAFKQLNSPAAWCSHVTAARK